MGIFRGVGGTGDSTDDGVVDAVTEQAVIATNKATEAATSATSAYNSAQSASTSKDTAITQANAAQSSANTASTHASNASTSATSAASSATSATASATTATTKASEASTSATNAATSETNAATSASTATTKASEAATSATTATTKAGEASTSATNAAASATSASTSASTATTKASEASTSAASAASSYDDFDDRYLGAKSSAPSTDNDGDALVTGALYFDTSSDSMKVWSGSAWLDAYASLSGALIATNNLSDLNNAGTARTNLGLGTAATTASTDYATAAQGTTADNALPKSGGAMTGAITTNSTFDGRDVSADGTKLDGIEAGATADQTASEIKTAYESNADTNAFTDADHTKLDGIEASADVTDTANVTAAGALMDSELTSEASVKALNQGVATTDSPTFAGLTVDTNTLYVDSTNNRVGIGTSSPAYSLDIRGEAGLELYNASGGGDVLNLRPSLGDANKYNMSISSYDHSGGGVGPADGISINAFDGVSVATGSSTARQERMRIDSSGNVGIGTSSPQGPLHVYGTDYSYFTSNVAGVTPHSATQGIALGWNKSSGAGESIIAHNKGGGSTGGLVFANNDGGVYREDMRIDSSGNVGIGTTSPAVSLHVNGGTDNQIGLIESTDATVKLGFKDNSTTNNYSVTVGAVGDEMTFTSGSGGTEAMRINSSGELLVGRTTATGGGSVADDAQAYFNGGVNRAGVPFTDFNDVWVSLQGGIIEGRSGFQPSNGPSSAGNWFHVTAYSMFTGGSTIYVTQVCTTITGRIFTRYIAGVTTGGSWSSWVEK